MSVVESHKKTVVLIAFCLLGSFVLTSSFPQGTGSKSRFGSGFIEVQDLDLSKGRAKLLFVFDDETGFTDFLNQFEGYSIPCSCVTDYQVYVRYQG